MPCTFTTDRQTYFGRTHWHDAEQNLDGAIAAGLDYDGFYAAFAPRPAAIGAVTWDFFPIEGTRLAYQRLQKLYGLLGVPERIALCEVETGHSYHPVLRRFAAEWFNRWLQPEAAPRELTDFVPEHPETMRNLPSGQVSISWPGNRGIFEQNADELEAIRAGRSVPAAPELARRLGLPAPLHTSPARILAERVDGGLTLQKGFLVTEFGEEPDAMVIVPFLRLAPDHPTRVLVWAGDEGVAGIGAADEALLRKIATAGCAIYLAEPRGLGETRSRPLGPHDGDGRFAELWLSQGYRQLGSSLGALRAFDLLRVMDYARASHPGLPLGLLSDGLIGWAAVWAAALDRGVDRLCLRGLRPSLDEYATTWTASPPEPYTVPGILQMGDMADFVVAAGVGQVLLVDPCDCAGRAVSMEEWASHYAEAWRPVPGLQVSAGAETVERNRVVGEFLRP